LINLFQPFSFEYLTKHKDSPGSSYVQHCSLERLLPGPATWHRPFQSQIGKFIYLAFSSSLGPRGPQARRGRIDPEGNEITYIFLVSSIEAYASALMSKWRRNTQCRRPVRATRSRSSSGGTEDPPGRHDEYADREDYSKANGPFPASIPWKTRGLYGTFKEEQASVSGMKSGLCYIIIY
jgi:hypothetical protein